MLHKFPLCPMTHHFLLGILLAFALVLSGKEEGRTGGRKGAEGEREQEREKDHSNADQYRLTALHPYWFWCVTQECTLCYTETSLIIQSHTGMPMPLLTTDWNGASTRISDASDWRTRLFPSHAAGKFLICSKGADELDSGPDSCSSCKANRRDLLRRSF